LKKFKNGVNKKAYMTNLRDSLYKGYAGGRHLGKVFSGKGILNFSPVEEKFAELYLEEIKDGAPLVERIAAISAVIEHSPAIARFWTPIAYKKIKEKIF
jgi:hypothetical protein